MRQRAGSRALLLTVVVLGGFACQPVDEVDPAGLDEGAEVTDDTGETVQDLAGLEEATGPIAREWDGDGRLVEVSVDLGEDLTWHGARATYVAPDAERMLLVRVQPSGATEQEQPTLETLGFVPPPEDALDEVPSLPEDLVDPPAAAEVAEEALSECGIAPPREVLYTTGAPAAWDGSTWTTQPAWRVSVLAERGGVRVDEDGSASPDGCFEVP